jgi:hypothetical protein
MKRKTILLRQVSGDLPRVFDIVNGFLIDAVEARVIAGGVCCLLLWCGHNQSMIIWLR